MADDIAFLLEDIRTATQLILSINVDKSKVMTFKREDHVGDLQKYSKLSDTLRSRILKLAGHCIRQPKLLANADVTQCKAVVRLKW